MKIYLATSWRNSQCTEVIEALRKAGHEVYDFRDEAFGWGEVGLDGTKKVDALKLLGAISQPVARAAYGRDMAALNACDLVVLLLPCGKSAHLEAGWAEGKGKKVLVYSQAPTDLELMYLMTQGIFGELPRLLEAVAFFAGHLKHPVR